MFTGDNKYTDSLYDLMKFEESVSFETVWSDGNV